jgi:hypothetical protein
MNLACIVAFELVGRRHLPPVPTLSWLNLCWPRQHWEIRPSPVDGKERFRGEMGAASQYSKSLAPATLGWELLLFDGRGFRASQCTSLRSRVEWDVAI